MKLLDKLFKPDLTLDKITDFDASKYKALGYKAILLDLDNTLAPYYVKSIDQKAIEVIESLKNTGFKVLVFSNNSPQRVGNYLKTTDYEYLCYALKPLPFGYLRAKKKLGVELKDCISMGDQLLTDVLGAKRMKVFSVYVKPLVDKDSWSTKINRFLERKIFKRLGQ